MIEILQYGDAASGSGCPWAAERCFGVSTAPSLWSHTLGRVRARMDLGCGLLLLFLWSWVLVGPFRSPRRNIGERTWGASGSGGSPGSVAANGYLLSCRPQNGQNSPNPGDARDAPVWETVSQPGYPAPLSAPREPRRGQCILPGSEAARPMQRDDSSPSRALDPVGRSRPPASDRAFNSPAPQRAGSSATAALGEQSFPQEDLTFPGKYSLRGKRRLKNLRDKPSKPCPS